MNMYISMCVGFLLSLSVMVYTFPHKHQANLSLNLFPGTLLFPFNPSPPSPPFLLLMTYLVSL